jgi:hypothetical protein
MSAKLKWYHNWKTICMWALIRSSKIWGKLLCSPKISIDYLCGHAKCLHSFFSNKEKFIRKRAQHCNQYLDLSGTPGPLGYHDLAKDTVPKVPTKDFKFLWLLYMQSIQQQSEVARKKVHIKMSGQLLSWLNSSELTLSLIEGTKQSLILSLQKYKLPQICGYLHPRVLMAPSLSLVEQQPWFLLGQVQC